MALARTNLLGEISAEVIGSAGWTSGAFTPTNNSLLVVAVLGMARQAVSPTYTNLAISGGGWTYSSQAGTNATSGDYDVNIRIYTAPVTTGVSMTLNITTGGLDYQLLGASVVCYTGYDTGSPVGATATGTDWVGGTPGSPDGAEAITLSGAPATTSEVFAALSMDKETIGTAPGAAFSEIHELQAGGSGGFESEIRTGSTSTTVDWVDTHTGTGSIFKYAAAAVEIKAATDAPITDGPPLHVVRSAVRLR